MSPFEVIDADDWVTSVPSSLSAVIVASEILGTKQADDRNEDQAVENLCSTESQPESEPSGFLNRTGSPLKLEDFLPKPDHATKAVEHSQAWLSSVSIPRLELPSRLHEDPLAWQLRPSSSRHSLDACGGEVSQSPSMAAGSSCVPSCQISLEEPRMPPQATPWSSEHLEPPVLPATEPAEPGQTAATHALQTTSSSTATATRTSPMLHCSSCQKSQQQLLACSTQSAQLHTERHEAMKAGLRERQLHADLEEELVNLHRTQAELADNFQATELELEELRRLRVPTEAKWREEAGAWQGAYDAAKASAGQAQQEHSDFEHSASILETKVWELQRSLDETQWDLEDARAACNATENRSFSDAGRVEEEVGEARAVFLAEQAAAEAARAKAATAEVRLAASSNRLHGASRSTGSSAGSLAMHRARADEEERRCMELEAEVSDWHQRVSSGRAAFGRLRNLHNQARSQLEARGAKPSTVDRGCSPLARHTESAAEMELRGRLHSWEARLCGLQNENQQLKSLHRLDTERHAAKTERLRLKAERYRAGHADLRRLYVEQQGE